MILGNIFYAVIALAFVLGLFGLLALIARRFGLGYPIVGNNRKREKRLSLIEAMPLDAKRRLALVRRDNTEHLLVLGSSSELLIESFIPESDRSTDSRQALHLPATKEKHND